MIAAAEQQKKPKIDPAEFRFSEKRLSEMSQDELEELYRSLGLPPPGPLNYV